MATTTTAGFAGTVWLLTCGVHPPKPESPSAGVWRSGVGIRSVLPSTQPQSRRSSSLVRASGSQRGQEEEEEEKLSTQKNNTKEDLEFVWKLGAGSVAAAAAIKYGSVVLPEITKPSIVEALGIVSTPVLAAVLILVKVSREEQQQDQ